jgi:hypothetical protein
MAGKSSPLEVKQNHSPQLKEIKRTAANIQKMLVAQRLRVEQFLINERKIAYEHWAKHFLHHPIAERNREAPDLEEMSN